MRILFVTNLYPPHALGGMEQRCEEVVDRLRERGYICYVLTSRYGVEDPRVSEEGVVRALYLEADVHHYRPGDFFLRRPWRELANRRTLRQVLDSCEPDLVFIWGMWNLSARVAFWLEQWLPGQVAYSIGSYWPLDTDPHTVYWRSAGRSPLARVLLWTPAQLALGLLKLECYPPQLRFQHVSCCSQFVVDRLSEARVLPQGAVAILNGIEPCPFVANQRQSHMGDGLVRLLYFGGLAEHKGVHTAIEALGLLQQRGHAGRLSLTVVGAGQLDYEARLHSLTHLLALDDRVHFTGSVPRSQIPSILSKHDVFLFTSVWAEPFGRTIIEAMAAGLAVVGADVGGSREIFRYYPADMLFEPANAEALASRIEMLASDPGLVDHLGRIGRELVLRYFTIERMVDEIETWLKEILA